MRVNERIRATEVRLIDAKGEQAGLVPLEEAMELATRQNLDLVEVAPDAAPPVCKIMDYRRYMFENKRRQKEARKKAKTFELKEIKLRPNIDVHDYGIKMERARGFLEKGHKVKVTM
ncbi:translation initiation factor IF-3, partial [Candidatus Sumerlaeota bacterium]|nr:translation initiation factor IF-3 [Candidatus Sumerlaeota bacterium]